MIQGDSINVISSFSVIQLSTLKNMKIKCTAGGTMGNILNLIDENMDGNSWEDLCVQCYRMRYQNDNYTQVPASNGGDAGIEGFTHSGVVHQCYYPERDYDVDKLYDHQRNKVTHDIQKLLDNGDRFKELGVPVIKEWHFNVPEYKDTRILKHLANKEAEVLRAKKDDPDKYSYISDSFRIIIKIAADFIPEISQIIRNKVNAMRIDLGTCTDKELDWSKCDSNKSANIQRKITAVMHTTPEDTAAQYVIGKFIEAYINGIEQMGALRINFPEIHHDLCRLEQSSKIDVSIKTHMNTDRTLNQKLFNDVLDNFEKRLQGDFADVFTQPTIDDLKRDLVASWLADCSMEFWSE